MSYGGQVCSPHSIYFLLCVSCRPCVAHTGRNTSMAAHLPIKDSEASAVVARNRPTVPIRSA